MASCDTKRNKHCMIYGQKNVESSEQTAPTKKIFFFLKTLFPPSWIPVGRVQICMLHVHVCVSFIRTGMEISTCPFASLNRIFQVSRNCKFFGAILFLESLTQMTSTIKFSNPFRKNFGQARISTPHAK